MKIPTVEILEPLNLGQTETGATAVLVGRILNYKEYSNIGVLYVKAEKVEGMVFSVPASEDIAIYIEDRKEQQELRGLWSFSGLADKLAEKLGFNNLKN